MRENVLQNVLLEHKPYVYNLMTPEQVEESDCSKHKASYGTLLVWLIKLNLLYVVI